LLKEGSWNICVSWKYSAFKCTDSHVYFYDVVVWRLDLRWNTGSRWEVMSVASNLVDDNIFCFFFFFLRSKSDEQPMVGEKIRVLFVIPC
jgi:hypothetical protein